MLCSGSIRPSSVLISASVTGVGSDMAQRSTIAMRELKTFIAKDVTRLMVR